LTSSGTTLNFVAKRTLPFTFSEVEQMGPETNELSVGIWGRGKKNATTHQQSP
jgi:hypothetical protein